MSRIFSGGLTLFVVGVVTLVIVGDVNAGHRRRRRDGGCCGCAGYAAPVPAYYGGGKYGYTSPGYGAGYARQYAPAYYRGYGYSPAVGGAVYSPGPVIQSGALIDAGQFGAAGTANADIGPADRSARLDNRGLTPAQGGIQADANLGAPNAGNADQGIRSNSDLQGNVGPQGNLNVRGTGSADANLPATPPVAP